MKDLLKIYNYAKWQYKTSCSVPSVDRYRSANVPLDVPLRNQNNCVAGRHIGKCELETLTSLCAPFSGTKFINGSFYTSAGLQSAG